MKQVRTVFGELHLICIHVGMMLSHFIAVHVEYLSLHSTSNLIDLKNVGKLHLLKQSDVMQPTDLKFMSIS